MSKRQYAFHLRMANTGVKVIGGIQSADTMEQAAQRVVARCHLVYHKEEQRTDDGDLLAVTHHHLYQGEKVYLYITAHPEYLPAQP